MSERPSFAPTSTPHRSRDRSLPRRPSFGNLATPARPTAPPLPSASHLSASTTSPHYTTSLRSRHSLYGTEDRVVLDLGSSVWKAGFSGEGSPRECRGVVQMLAKEVGGGAAACLWGLEKSDVAEEEWEVREERLKRGLRDVWFNHLMADPKSRKVVVVENPLLSTRVKDMVARVLFDNLQVPSLSFASAPVLALMATGSITGLVVDCGHLETTILPIYASRPLFNQVLSTPRAGARLTARLRNLLLRYGSFVPPPSSLNSSSPPVVTRIPRDVLTEELIEEIKTRACFVGEAQAVDAEAELFSEKGEMDTERDDEDEAALLRRMEKRYSATTTSTTISIRVPSLNQPPVMSGVGRGWIQIPGWVRERAAEVLFEEGDDDEGSLPEMILQSLMKLPIDLRKPLASSILITGGTSMLPGFFSRLRSSLLDALTLSHLPSPPQSPPLDPPTPRAIRHAKLSQRLSTLRATPRFASLVPLTKHIALTNDPSRPTAGSPTLPKDSGQAPAFAPALLNWVGGSLAGALKTGGEEIKRESWQEVLRSTRAGEDEDVEVEPRAFVLPDWTSL